MIDHPEGLLLVDTGPVIDPDRPRRWRTHRWHLHYLLAYRARAGTAGSLRAAIEAAGIDPDAIETVVLTNCHPDHVGGLRELEVETVLVNRPELAFARSLRGRFWGLNPATWPGHTPFCPVDLEVAPTQGVGERTELPNHPGVHLVATPGHTHHHCSVLVERERADVLIAGDATYDLDHLIHRRIDGVATRPHAARRSVEFIDEMASDRPLIVLPSHDIDAPDRLREELVYRPEG